MNTEDKRSVKKEDKGQKLNRKETCENRSVEITFSLHNSEVFNLVKDKIRITLWPSQIIKMNELRLDEIV